MSKSEQSASDHQAPPPEGSPHSPAHGLMILGIVVVVVGVFIALAHVLSIAEVWVAYLFLFYWAAVEQMDLKKVPACTVGAVVGLGAASALHALPTAMGMVGGVICLVGLLALIYVHIMVWFPLAVNLTTMLFLTVGTIPLIQTGTEISSLLLALGAGVAYFAGLAWVSGWVVAQRAANKAET